MSSPAEIDRAVIAALGSGAPPANMTELRRATGAPAKPLSEAVQRLRFQGKILFDRLELSPSMRGTLSRAGIEAEPEPIEARPLGAPEGAAAEAQSRAPEAAPSPSSDPTGPELHAEILTWCERTGTRPTNFSVAAFGNSATIFALFKVTRPRQGTINQARDLMAAYPDGISREEALTRHADEPAAPPDPPAPAPAAESPLAAAVFPSGAIRPVRSSPPPAGSPPPTPPPSLTPVERVATMLADEPNDLMLAIERRHKRIWWRIVLLSRQLGKRPGEALYDVLEAGLAELDPEPANEARAA